MEKKKKKKNTGKHPTPKRPGVAVVTVAVGEHFETVFFPPFSHAGWVDGTLLTRSRNHSVYFVMEDGIILDK